MGLPFVYIDPGEIIPAVITDPLDELAVDELTSAICGA